MRIWSIVVTKLNLCNFETLNNRTRVNESIMWILENIYFNNDYGRFREFLNDFMERQVQILSPGVALAAANAINNFRNEHRDLKMSFECFFIYIVRYMSKILSTRAPSIDLNNRLSLCNRFFFLGDHFCYLEHPSNPDKWAFVTIMSCRNQLPLEYYEEHINSSAPWRTYRK